MLGFVCLELSRDTIVDNPDSVSMIGWVNKGLWPRCFCHVLFVDQI